MIPVHDQSAVLQETKLTYTRETLLKIRDSLKIESSFRLAIPSCLLKKSIELRPLRTRSVSWQRQAKSIQRPSS